MTDIGALFVQETLAALRATKEQADGAIAQVSDVALLTTIDPEANSIAVLMRHMAGNMRSRWTDFLTSDGEKPGRNRDGEFEPTQHTRAELLADWESGWRATVAAIEPLTSTDLAGTVTIGGKPCSVIFAIQRQVRHYAEHAGQIVLLAKHFAGPNWKTLSVPRKRAGTG